MAKYTQDRYLDKPADFVDFMIKDYLEKTSFTQKTWKGSPVYRRGDGFFEGFRYLDWSYSNGTLHLEAWFKGPFGGEQGLTGFWGWGAKAAYRKEINQLIELLQQQLPDPSYSGGASSDGTTPTQTVKVRTVDNPRSAIFALVFGLASIFLCWIPLLSLVAGCLGVMFSRSGKGSSKAGLAKGGMVCAIVGMSLSLVLLILNAFVIGVGLA